MTTDMTQYQQMLLGHILKDMRNKCNNTIVGQLHLLHFNPFIISKIVSKCQNCQKLKREQPITSSTYVISLSFQKLSGGIFVCCPSDYIRIVSVYKISTRKEITLEISYQKEKFSSTLKFCYWKRVSITIK